MKKIYVFEWQIHKFLCQAIRKLFGYAKSKSRWSQLGKGGAFHLTNRASGKKNPLLKFETNRNLHAFGDCTACPLTTFVHCFTVER